MKYNHAVIQDGTFYAAGVEVPENEAEETPIEDVKPVEAVVPADEIKSEETPAEEKPKRTRKAATKGER